MGLRMLIKLIPLFVILGVSVDGKMTFKKFEVLQNLDESDWLSANPTVVSSAK